MKKELIFLAVCGLLATTVTHLSAEDKKPQRKKTLDRLKNYSPEFTHKDLAKPMSRAIIESGLKSHDKALFIKDGWIRDPYIVRGPDDYYYLTGTMPNRNDPREKSDPLNIGLGASSIVGTQVQVWRSKDLIDWEDLGIIYDSKKDADGSKKKDQSTLGSRSPLARRPLGPGSLP